MNEAISIFTVLGLGYGVRFLQDYRFWYKYRQQRRIRSEVAVDTARMLNGLSKKMPVITVSPLVRQYLNDQRMFREKVLAWFGNREPYVARHSASGYSPSEIVQMNTSTATFVPVEDS